MLTHLACACAASAAARTVTAPFDRNKIVMQVQGKHSVYVHNEGFHKFGKDYRCVP